MKICLVSKYPPIEGGVSSKNYWFSKALGKMGHKIFVVTNAWEVEDEYREIFKSSDLDLYQPKNVKLFNTDPLSNPGHIPYSKTYVEKISSLAIDVVEEYDVDLIDSKYLVPYGVAGYLASHFTKKPMILRHAGSDMGRLLYSPYLKTLLVKIIKNASKIVTQFPREEFTKFSVPEDRIINFFQSFVDTEEFSPSKAGSLKEYGMDESLATLTFVGKPSRYRGINNLLNSCSQIKSGFNLLLVIGKSGGDYDFIRKKVDDMGIGGRTKIIDFLPPWRMPKILSSSTAVICPENNFPIHAHSPIIPRETMACGTCPVISRELFDKNLWMGIKDGVDVVVVDPLDRKQFSKKLNEIVSNPEKAWKIGDNARKISEKKGEFKKYVSGMLEIYENILSGG